MVPFHHVLEIGRLVADNSEYGMLKYEGRTPLYLSFVKIRETGMDVPHLLRDRAIIHFIDNTGALSALVHGYASKPDLARLVNVYHVQVVGLRCMTWHE